MADNSFNIDILVDDISREDIEGMIQRTKEIGKRTVHYTALDSVSELRQRSPVDHGILARNWLIRSMGSLAKGVYNNTMYLNFVLYGTRGGVTRPFDPIAQWARRKGLPAGAVWRSICLHGTKANDFLSEAVDKVEGNINSHINRAIREVGEI